MARLVLLLGCFLALAGCISARPDKIVCYYGSWAVYRPGEGKFDVEQIDPTKCTHLIYGFVGINWDGSIKILDAWNEIDLGALRRFNELKNQNPSLKTLIAIGGWNEGSATFSQVAADAGLRQAFAQNALNFIREHGFDGFDMDWEYPGDRGGQPADMENFNLLLQALRQTFDASGQKYLLTAAVGASTARADQSYDIPTISGILDFINLMTYDFHGAFDGKTGQNAPMYATDGLSVSDSVQLWLGRGCPPSKLVLGMGVYGRTFTVADPSVIGENNGIGHEAYAGEAGPFTREMGILGYNEICIKRQEGGWTEIWDDNQKVPAIYQGNQFVGYDNEQSISIKTQYAIEKDLGGVMIWSIETDDVYGHCGRPWGILNTLNELVHRKNA